MKGREVNRAGRDSGVLHGSGRGGASLEGATWICTACATGAGTMDALIAGSEITAVFGHDGRVSGSGGVNRYHGGYKVSGADLDIGPLATTLMAGPEDLMQQEMRYLQLLERATCWRIEGSRLTLLAGVNDQAPLLVYGVG